MTDPAPLDFNNLFESVAAIARADAERITAKWNAMTPEEKQKQMRAELDAVKKWERGE